MRSPQELLASVLDGVHSVEYEFSSSAPNQPEWQVRRFALNESISGRYIVSLELGTERLRDPASLLGKPATVRWIRRAEQAVHGIVDQVTLGAASAGLRTINVRIVPALSVLAHTGTSRIFSDLTVPEVVESVLSASLSPFGRKVKLDLAQSSYPKREYIVQHRETDLGFVARLLAEQGLWYYFVHPTDDDAAAEELVITDSLDRVPGIGRDPSVELATDREQSEIHETVRSFGFSEELKTTSVYVRQFDWTHPDVSIEGTKEVEDSSGVVLPRYYHDEFAAYDYQEPRYRKHDAEAQGQLHLERFVTERSTFRGVSNVTSLRAGHFVRIEDQEYLITSVSHTGSTVFNTGQSNLRGDYSNTFTCVLRDRPFRPARIEKPRIIGVQTATVVDRMGKNTAPSSSGDGEDIVTDKHGRVRVKFPWDLTAAGQGGTNSCWLRVAQAWAGAGWGLQFIPRVGMEVIVQFIDGDPDRPIITGCVYNGLNAPPYANTPTQSGIKTASSVDPSRYNELRFEDAKDNEQIFVRAQKDYVEEVLNNHNTTVHANQNQTVKKNQSEAVNGNASLAVGGSRNKVVGGSETIKVKGTRTTTVVKKNAEIYEDEYEQTVAAAVTITHNDTRTTTVKNDDIETITDGNKAIFVVSGTYEVRSNGALTLVQNGEHSLHFDNNAHLQTSADFTITNGKCGVASGGAELQVSADSAIKIGCGSAQIELKSDGSINITGTKISITAGNNSIVADQTGVTVSGVKVSSTAVGIHEIQGAMIKIG